MGLKDQLTLLFSKKQRELKKEEELRYIELTKRSQELKANQSFSFLLEQIKRVSSEGYTNLMGALYDKGDGAWGFEDYGDIIRAKKCKRSISGSPWVLKANTTEFYEGVCSLLNEKFKNGKYESDIHVGSECHTYYPNISYRYVPSYARGDSITYTEILEYMYVFIEWNK